MGRRGFRSAFLSAEENAETKKGCLMQPLSPRLPILAVELNPPARIAILKVLDFFYNSKLFTIKISDYEKEIGFYHC